MFLRANSSASAELCQNNSTVDQSPFDVFGLTPSNEVHTNETRTNSLRNELLRCPVHRTGLRNINGRLICAAGHDIPIEEGVPVFAERPRREPKPLNMPALPRRTASGPVDEFVDDWIVNTNGNLYWRVRGRLPRYPIPRWPGRKANRRSEVLVDIGCSWGRWTVAAARAGYSVRGVDIHLDALWAARRVTQALGVDADFACAEASRLPFGPDSVDFAFSYSVLQHLDKNVARKVLKEIARILRPGGACLVQLPNALGLMSLVRQAKRGFRQAMPDTFEMRYWTRSEIRQAFLEADLGKMRFRPEGFLLQNTQAEDLDLLSSAGAAAVRVSCHLRDAANKIPMLAGVADSLWVETTKE